MGVLSAPGISGVTVVPYREEDADAVVRLLARAYTTNPLHVAAFGRDDIARNESFFRIGLGIFQGAKVIALQGNRLVGFMHWVRSPACLLPPRRKLGLAPHLAATLGVRSTLRVVSWLAAWTTHDPATPHAHLGPIAVAPEAQSCGIGSRLMRAFCERLDASTLAGYLETDRAENVRFYQRFGFEVTASTAVLGVTTYFMKRHRGIDILQPRMAAR